MLNKKAISFVVLPKMAYLCILSRIKGSRMSKKLSTVIGLIAHYKYLITIVLGVVLVGFVDENSFLQRAKYDIRIDELKEEIAKYNKQTEAANEELRALAHDPLAIEKIARERYFMKADDEDIFVLRSDKYADNSNDNSTETNEATE